MRPDLSFVTRTPPRHASGLRAPDSSFQDNAVRRPFVWISLGVSFSLALLGTIQVFFAGSLNDPKNGYVHGLHGGLALFVAALAWYIARREARALGLGASRPTAAT